MATITFTSAHMTKTVFVDVSGLPAPTLLAIAQAHGVPVPFNCTFGGCGACLVRIKEKTIAHAAAGAVGPGEDEAWLLDAMGKLTPEDTGFVEADGLVESYRLACQYVIRGDEEIEVAYDETIGSR
jgi:ferredoxin